GHFLDRIWRRIDRYTQQVGIAILYSVHQNVVVLLALAKYRRNSGLTDRAVICGGPCGRHRHDAWSQADGVQEATAKQRDRRHFCSRQRCSDALRSCLEHGRNILHGHLRRRTLDLEIEVDGCSLARSQVERLRTLRLETFGGNRKSVASGEQ